MNGEDQGSTGCISLSRTPDNDQISEVMTRGTNKMKKLIRDLHNERVSALIWSIEASPCERGKGLDEWHYPSASSGYSQSKGYLICGKSVVPKLIQIGSAVSTEGWHDCWYKSAWGRFAIRFALIKNMPTIQGDH